MITSDQSEADRGWFLLQRLIITPASQTGASLISNCQTNGDDDRGVDDDGDQGDDGGGDGDQGDDGGDGDGDHQEQLLPIQNSP